MSFLSGRLGIDTAKIPHNSRHGILWLERGVLTVEAGCLLFKTAGFDGIPAGEYGIPHQSISTLLIGPGTTTSHDVFRILASQGTSILFTGSGGVRIYSAPPLMPDSSEVARKQVTLWADKAKRTLVARKMYAIRFGEILPHKSLDVLRGIEGSRLKVLYGELGRKHGIDWQARRFDRLRPDAADIPNQCLNHVATSLYASAAIAVYSIGAIPQLGFIHESSGQAFCQDIADLYRADITIPVAFQCANHLLKNADVDVERYCRQEIRKTLKNRSLVDQMIDRIKDLFDVNDASAD